MADSVKWPNCFSVLNIYFLPNEKGIVTEANEDAELNGSERSCYFGEIFVYYKYIFMYKRNYLKKKKYMYNA